VQVCKCCREHPVLIIWCTYLQLMMNCTQSFHSRQILTFTLSTKACHICMSSSLCNLSLHKYSWVKIMLCCLFVC
jgi:hypothetical protein